MAKKKELSEEEWKERLRRRVEGGKKGARFRSRRADILDLPVRQAGRKLVSRSASDVLDGRDVAKNA